MDKNAKSRRKFLKAGLLASAVLNFNTLAMSSEKKFMQQKMFIHHVYFWLKNADRKEDYEKLLKGLEALSKVQTIKNFHVGIPANTRRDVIDSSYSVSWMLMFDNAADQESYQKDPIHLKFVADCSSLWNKVVVYDAVDI